MMRRPTLAALFIAGFGIFATSSAGAQETCSGQNCMPAQDEDLTDCKGQDCTLPAPDDQDETCKGEGCTPVNRDSESD